MTSTRAPSPDVVITHPNRDSAASKGTRFAVILIQAASAILLTFITIVSASIQQGALGLQVIFILLFAYFTYAVIKWRSGVLPIAAGTAVISGIFAAVSVMSWFNRGTDGYDEPLVPKELVGTLVLAFAILQVVNTVVSLRGFTQNWHVELEVPRSEASRGAQRD